jgi:hypothetical protein
MNEESQQNYIGGHKVPVARMKPGYIYLYNCKRKTRDGLESVAEPIEYLGNSKGKRIGNIDSKPFSLTWDATLEIGSKT